MNAINWKDYEIQRNVAHGVKNMYKTRVRSPRLLELVVFAALSFGIFSLFCLAAGDLPSSHSSISEEFAHSDAILESQEAIQDSDGNRPNRAIETGSMMEGQPASLLVVENSVGK